MIQYAAKTQVPTSRSQEEIRKTLKRYDATAFGFLEAENGAAVEFNAHNRRIRFLIEMPSVDDRKFTSTPTGRARSGKQVAEHYEQAVRQRWRALALVIKAKLEAVDSGIVSFESEFLPFTVLPSGNTVAEEIGPQVEAAYSGGEIPPLQIER